MAGKGGVDDSILTPDVDVTARAKPVEPAAAQPDLTKTEAAVEGRRARSIQLTVLSVLAVLYTLYFAREFLLPIVFALLLNFLLSPVVRWFTRFRIPPPISAAVVILGILALLGTGVFGLSG